MNNYIIIYILKLKNRTDFKELQLNYCSKINLILRNSLMIATLTYRVTPIISNLIYIYMDEHRKNTSHLNSLPIHVLSFNITNYSFNSDKYVCYKSYYRILKTEPFHLVKNVTYCH